MNGTMLIISPSGSTKTSPLHAVPDLERLQEEVGGSLEQVPSFDSVAYRGTTYPCVAFCDEEGKIKTKQANIPATKLWMNALARHGIPAAKLDDVLCGKVIVIFGDRELMSAL